MAHICLVFLLIFAYYQIMKGPLDPKLKDINKWIWKLVFHPNRIWTKSVAYSTFLFKTNTHIINCVSLTLEITRFKDKLEARQIVIKHHLEKNPKKKGPLIEGMAKFSFCNVKKSLYFVLSLWKKGKWLIDLL